MFGWEMGKGVELERAEKRNLCSYVVEKKLRRMI